jgi:FkbM family methyltransferase
MIIKTKVINFLLDLICSPLLKPICWGRQIPQEHEQWKHVSFSWSQFGEDLVIRSALQKINLLHQPMIYIDVGAFHPVKYSNTLLLQKIGWKGINIDPNPASIDLFVAERPADLNVQCGISSKPGQGIYSQRVKGEISAIGSLVGQEGDSINAADDDESCLIQVPIRRLDEILKDYQWNDWRFGLLNIDTEGTELEVLESNDWGQFRPLLISIEENHPNYSKIDPFLKGHDYILIAECFLTKIFLDATCT